MDTRLGAVGGVVTSTPTISPRDSLPHWESIPADVPGAVREVKAAIRA